LKIIDEVWEIFINTDTLSPLLLAIDAEGRKIKNPIVYNSHYENLVTVFNDNKSRKYFTKIHSVLSDCQSYFYFFDSYHLFYCLKTIYREGAYIGSLVVGGYNIINFENGGTSGTSSKFINVTGKEAMANIERDLRNLESSLNKINVSFLEILSTLKKNPTKKFTLNELSKLHFVSETTIRRFFLFHEKKTFQEYYKDLKIEMGINMWKETGNKISIISEELGYKDSRGFRDELKSMIKGIEEYE